jgi:hypothetical protein
MSNRDFRPASTIRSFFSERRDLAQQFPKAIDDIPRFCRVCCKTFMTGLAFDTHRCRHECKPGECAGKLEQFKREHPKGRIV